MQISLWLALTVLLLPDSYAQGWQRHYHNQNFTDGAEVVKALPMPGDSFLLLIEDASFTNPDHIRLVQTDGMGIPASEQLINFGKGITAQGLIRTTDNGFALIYSERIGSQVTTKLQKLDAQFNLVFERDVQQIDPNSSFQGVQLLETAAGLCIIGSQTQPTASHGFLICYDLNGSLVNQANWGLPIGMIAGGACLTPDGGVVAVGQGFDGATFNTTGIVATRFNADGSQVLWEKVVYQQSMLHAARTIAPTPDGGYLIGGTEFNNAYLVKLDAQGNVLWEQKFLNLPDFPDGLGAVVGLSPTVDGTGYWATIKSNAILFLAQPLLCRLDTQGNLQSYTAVGPGFNEYFGRFIEALPDGGCIATGAQEANPDLNANRFIIPFAIRLDSTGRQFQSGISGLATGDLDDDCLSDVDSLLEGQLVQAFKNGTFAGSARVGPNGNYQINLDTGNYQVTIPPPSPLWFYCPDTLTTTVLAQDTITGVDFTGFYNVQPVDSIFGYVFEDYDGDCIKDPFEPAYPNWTIVANLFHQGTFLFETTTDSNGYFIIIQPAGITNEYHGNFSIAPPANDGLTCTVTCLQDFNIEFGNSTTFEAMFGMHCDSLAPHPVMEVDLATIGLRPCQSSDVQVSYCNNGAVTAEDAQLEVTIDPALTVQSSSVPWDAVNGNVYTFLLGDLITEACGTITIKVKTPCSDPLGTTYCFEAHGYPDSLSQAPAPSWDGSKIEVSAACTGDSVTFTIQNVGTGNMSQAQDYIVIEDNVLLMQAPGQFQLVAGGSFSRSFPATGAFYRLEAEQTPGLPGLSTPVAWVEGCNSNGGPVSLGFVNQYPLPDVEPWLDLFCLESTNSYDPNDKNGFPRGYAPEHFIEENTDIEYLIRFQNTGTAPALEVELRDTIPVQFLNPLTVRPGASSHPYEWDMQGGGVVVFRFPGINLPDSASNPELSQGFVKFRVSQHADLPPGTEIRNTAAIYFDNNAPVITNQTLHTIGHNFIQTTGTQNLLTPDVTLRISPNPMDHWVQVQAIGLKQHAALQFRLINQLGQVALELNPASPVFGFDAGTLPRGVYFYEFRKNSRLVVSGKLVK